jgi:hypothetical protein
MKKHWLWANFWPPCLHCVGIMGYDHKHMLPYWFTHAGCQTEEFVHARQTLCPLSHIFHTPGLLCFVLILSHAQRCNLMKFQTLMLRILFTKVGENQELWREVGPLQAPSSQFYGAMWKWLLTIFELVKRSILMPHPHFLLVYGILLAQWLTVLFLGSVPPGESWQL